MKLHDFLGSHEAGLSVGKASRQRDVERQALPEGEEDDGLDGQELAVRAHTSLLYVAEHT